MSGKVDIRPIIYSHWRTLPTLNSRAASIEDFFIFYGLPLVAAILFAWFSGVGIGPKTSQLSVDTKIDEVLISAFSIFAGLMLNIQVFLLGYRMTVKSESRKYSSKAEIPPEEAALTTVKRERKEEFFEQLFSNISYSILVSLLLVSLTLIAVF